MWIETEIHKHLLLLSVSGKPLLTLPYYVEVNGQAQIVDGIQADGLQVQARWRECTITDIIERSGAMLTVRRRWNLMGQFRSRLWFVVMRRMAPLNWMAPGLAYHVEGERRNLGMLPDPFWGRSVPEDAVTAPSCIVLEDRRSCFGVFAAPAETEEELTAATARLAGDFVEIGIRAPGVPVANAVWNVDGHLAYERVFYVYIGEKPATPGRPVLEAAWAHFAPDRAATQTDWGAAAAQRAQFMVKHFFIERNDAVGFLEKLTSQHIPWPARLEAETNFEAALGLYLAGVETDMKPIRRMALDVADFFIESAEGSVAPEYRLGRRRWAKPAESERSLLRQFGSGAYHLLALHAMAESRGDANERWLMFIRKICTLLLQHQRDDGSLTLPGQGDGPGDLQGLYGIWILAEAGARLGEPGYIAAAEKAMARYSGAIEKWVFIDTTEEPPCLSRDLAGAALRALRLLHRQTGQASYVELAERTAHFFSTWVYCYDAPMSERGAAGKRGLRVVGGARVDTRTSGFDFAGLQWAQEMLYLWKVTGNHKWRNLAEMQMSFAGQLWDPQSKPASFSLFNEDYQPDLILTSAPAGASQGQRGTSAGISLSTTARTLVALFNLKQEHPDVVKFTVPQLSIEPTKQNNIANIISTLISYIPM